AEAHDAGLGPAVGGVGDRLPVLFAGDDASTTQDLHRKLCRALGFQREVDPHPFAVGDRQLPPLAAEAIPRGLDSIAAGWHLDVVGTLCLEWLGEGGASDDHDGAGWRALDGEHAPIGLRLDLHSCWRARDDGPDGGPLLNEDAAIVVFESWADRKVVDLSCWHHTAGGATEALGPDDDVSTV